MALRLDIRQPVQRQQLVNLSYLPFVAVLLVLLIRFAAELGVSDKGVRADVGLVPSLYCLG